MKYIIKAIIIIFLFAISLSMYSCANARWGANAGVDVRWGPNGPKLHPHVGVDLYSGGRL